MQKLIYISALISILVPIIAFSLMEWEYALITWFAIGWLKAAFWKRLYELMAAYLQDEIIVRLNQKDAEELSINMWELGGNIKLSKKEQQGIKKYIKDNKKKISDQLFCKKAFHELSKK